MPLASIELKRRLRWADADAAGRLHFPRIFEVVEEAESELLRSLAWPLDARRRGYDFPRVNINCDFKRIIALDAPYRLRFRVGKLGRASIRYDFQVFDAEDKLAINGTMTVVVMHAGALIEIPAELRAALTGDAPDE